MKLEPLFRSADNRLYFLDGREMPVDAGKKSFPENVSCEKDSLVFVDMPWETVGKDEESYNEEFLARMRDFLKKMEDIPSYAVIFPTAESIPQSAAEKEAFVASMKHSARRIKDAKSVVGYAIPGYIDAETFVSEFSGKHSHYIYFSHEDSVLENPSIVRI